MEAQSAVTDQNVLFMFSTDGGPRNNLKRLQEPAARGGWRVVFPSVEECTLASAESLLRSHASPRRKLVVLTGLSSFKNGVELKLGECVKTLIDEGNAVEWWIIADTHYAGLRPPARGKIAHARGVFPATEAEIPEYREFGYTPARIYYVGGPPEWQAFWRVKPVDINRYRPDIRPLFYFGGVKDPGLTDAFLQVGFAGSNLACRRDCDIIVGLHPIEDGKPKDIPIREWTRQRVTKLLEKWHAEYGVTFKNVIFDIDPKITSAELTVTADYPFSTGGGTDGIVAAMHRKAAFFWETDEVRKRNIVQMGREEWFPAEEGALIKVATTIDVAREINLLNNPMRQSELRAAQEKLYPRPSESELTRPVAENILDWIVDPGTWA